MQKNDTMSAEKAWQIREYWEHDPKNPLEPVRRCYIQKEAYDELLIENSHLKYDLSFFKTLDPLENHRDDFEELRRVIDEIESLREETSDLAAQIRRLSESDCSGK